MLHLLRCFSLVVAGIACLAVGVAAGCGSAGSGDSTGGRAGDVLARVGNVAITRAALDQRMVSVAGGAYYALSHSHTFPDGIVSDPWNNTRCATRLRTLAAKSATHGVGLSTAALIRTCGLLERTLRNSAMEDLVKAQWFVNLDRKLGITVSDSEVLKLQERISSEVYPTKVARARYLQPRHMTEADLLKQAREDLLGQKLFAVMKAGSPNYKRAVQAAQQATSETTCDPEYVVEHCRQYKGAVESPPGTVVIEKVAAIVTGVCVNRPACGEFTPVNSFR
jgi:hypothetical protein